VFSSQNDTVQPSGLLPYTQLYVPGNSPTWQSIPYATFQSGYQAGFTATGIVGTDVLTVGSLPPVTQYVGVMWYDKPVMVSRLLSISCPFLKVSRCLKHVSAISPPKHAPLLIALTERRNADSETYLGLAANSGYSRPWNILGQHNRKSVSVYPLFQLSCRFFEHC